MSKKEKGKGKGEEIRGEKGKDKREVVFSNTSNTFSIQLNAHTIFDFSVRRTESLIYS